MNNIKEVMIDKEFKFNLTEQEFAEKGKEAAALSQDLSKIQYEFKEVKETFASRIKTKQAQRNLLLKCINDGFEKRTVQCNMIKDFDSKLVQYWFKGELMEERAMLEGEMQIEMKGVRS